MKYKVWLHIEEIDEDKDHYEDIELPDDFGMSFDTEKHARQFAESLLDEIEVQVVGGVAYCDDPRVWINDMDNH
jgi:hypothetical protein